MLCRNPVHRITIDEIKEHPWFPTHQYAIMIETIKSILPLDPDGNRTRDEINQDIISLMSSKGIDCSKLVIDLTTGEENETTILYKIYQRQELSQKMNHILRGLALIPRFSSTQASLPVIRSESMTSKPKFMGPRGALRGRMSDPSSPGPDKGLCESAVSPMSGKQVRTPLIRPSQRVPMIRTSIGSL
jgi:hypothetical protein